MPFTVRRHVNTAQEGVRWTGTEQNSEGGYKLRFGFKPFVDQSSWDNFETMQVTLYTSQRPWPIIYIRFRSDDICH